MKRIAGVVKWLVIVVVLTMVALWATGNSHVFTAVAHTYLKGRTGPTINDYKAFSNREVPASTHQPWAVSSRYNAIPLAAAQNSYLQELETVAFLVIQNDSVMSETYWDGYNENSLTNSFSVAKSIVGVLVGCALQDGLIKDINEPVVNYLPEYKDVTGDQVTIRHLLTMSSGINFNENYVNPFGMMARAYYGSDLKGLLHRYHPVSEPGKEFTYLGGNTQLLAQLVEKVTGTTLAAYASKKLWQSMGAKNTALWTTDKEGTERAFCCFYTNARDFARIGKLYLDSGRWNGQQLLPESYVLAASQPASDVMNYGHPLRIYGYQWWCNTLNGERMFYARGILGQYIIVRPEKNMIVVRLGHQRSSEYSNGHTTDFEEYIKIADAVTQ